MAVSHLTSHQYYRGLNRRFDRRVQLLARLRLEYDPEQVGWFNPRREWHAQHGKPNWRMPNCFLQHADNRAFYETLYRMVNGA